MTTTQPQQESLQVAELTPEQESRLVAAFTNPNSHLWKKDPSYGFSLNGFKQHLATELALQRRELATEFNMTVLGVVASLGYENILNSDQIIELNTRLSEALLQKETI